MFFRAFLLCGGRFLRLARFTSMLRSAGMPKIISEQLRWLLWETVLQNQFPANQ